jgi:hypothetical protein
MSNQLPLDIVSTTTCYGAFAVFRVSTSYTGPTITVRRSSDSATLDFYADPHGTLGSAINGTGTSLESWLGGSTGFVTKWWDQSGKGSHATQATAASQPQIDYVNHRLNFAGNTFFSLPNGTVPLGKPYSTTWGYISTNSASRTTVIPSSDNNAILEHLYEAVLTSTAYMNGAYILADRAATYMNGSRTAILNNEFSVVYGYYDGTYVRSARVVFRKNGNVIDCYQSQGLYWTGNVTEYNVATISDPNVTTGSGGYGVVQVTIRCNTAYTVTMKHNTIATTGSWLGAGGGGAVVHQTNVFRRDTNQYYNYWYGNDFQGNTNTYFPGNTVTYGYDGNYSYLYVNGAAQGVSPQRSNWNASVGNEVIGRNNSGSEYFNGEMYFLYIFKSFLNANERTHIERGMSAPVASANGIRFSQLKSVVGPTDTASFTLSNVNKYSGVASSSVTTLSSYDGFSVEPGLFMRIYWSQYFSNDPTWFNSNTPNITGVTTNLKNTYCATGGFNNPNTSDTAVGGIAATTVYSVEWTGLFYAPITGTYTFYLASDDSSYLWIGSTATSGYTTANALINNLYTGPAEKSATMSMTAGTYYPFRLQFGDAAGGEFITFTFAPPGQSRVYEGTGYYFCQTSTNPLYTIPATNLGLYFPFESSDVSGTTLTSRVPLAPTTATLVNGASVSTADYKLGFSSLSLTASSSQYVQIPSFTTTTNGLTFSFWYKSNSTGTWSRIFDFGNGQNNYNVLFSPNGNGSNGIGISVTGGDPYYLTDINYNDNTWRHITWTLTYAAENVTSSTWTVYVNGVSKASVSSRYYPPTVTRTSNYIGRSNWSDPYYNGYIDDFRVYHRVVTAAEAASLFSSSTHNYMLKNGATTMITQPQGTTPSNPATSGYALYACNPWLPNGTYWIKTASMPNALPMYVDVRRGGFDYYQITGGTSVNDITLTHSGTALGLELMIPRSQDHWRSIFNYVYNVLGSNYMTWLTALPIYKTTGGDNYSTSGGYYPLYDPRYGNNGLSHGGTVTYRLYWKPNLFPGQNTNTNSSYVLDTTNTTSTSLINSATNPQSYVLNAGTYNYSGTFRNDSNDYVTVTLVNNATSAVIVTVVNANIAPWTSATLLPGTFVITARTDVSVRFSHGYYQYASILDLTVRSTRGNGAVDWRCKDGGLWYLKDVPFGEPNGNYTANAFLGTYSTTTWPEWVSPHGCPGIDDATTTFYTGANYLVSTNYAGSTVSTLTVYFDGSTAERAAPSALYIKNMTGTNTNGVYWINLPTVGATQVYCIMDTVVDGGGWMMALKATRGTTFPYDSSHWTTVTTLNPSDTTRNDADAKFHTMNYFPSKDILALWPDIPHNYNSGTGGSLSLSGYNNWCWMRNNYNAGAKQTLINYFSTASNVSFGTPKGVERGTAFSSQAGNAFYGVNFTTFANMKVRWGLAWNNENDWFSNDVTGGIGLYTNWGAMTTSYSAGDLIGCCQDQTGINRSARVEMYVR